MSSQRRVLLDSNVIIEAGKQPVGAIPSFLATIEPYVSVVSRIEVLGFHRISPADKASLELYFGAVTIVPVSDDVVERAILLRQARKMTLGDSIIAATAYELQIPLLTRNVQDFLWISGLSVIDSAQLHP